MKIVWFALVAAVMVKARPGVETSTAPNVGFEVSSEREPGSTPKVGLEVSSEREPGSTPKVGLEVSTEREPGSTPKVGLEVSSEREPGSTPKVDLEVSTEREPGSTPKVGLEVSSEREPGSTPKVSLEVSSERESGSTPKVGLEVSSEREPGSTPKVDLEVSSEREPGSTPKVGLEVSSEREPGCISNWQPCQYSNKPCCRLEDRTSDQFGREDWICNRFLDGTCAPLRVIYHLPLFTELSERLNETNLSELTDLYWAGVVAKAKLESECKPEDESTCTGYYQSCATSTKRCCPKNLVYGNSSIVQRFVCETQRKICVPYIYGIPVATDIYTGIPVATYGWGILRDIKV